MRRVLLGTVVAVAMLVTMAGAVGAATLTLTPATIAYGDRATLNATGLTPGARYTLLIYDANYRPIQTVPFQATASASYSIAIGSQQVNLPGLYSYEIWPADPTVASPRVVARGTLTLTGTNTYHRLGRIYP